MRGDDTTFTEGTKKKLEVRLLEQSFGWAFRIARIRDDNVKGILIVLEELESVAHVGLGLGVLEANGHAGEILLGEANDSLNNN